MRESPLLEVSDLNAWYGECHILHGVSFEVEAGRGGDASRAQRRRQDDDDEIDHGPGAAASGPHPLRRPRADRHAVRSDRAAGDRLLPRGARHLREPRCRRRTFCCRPWSGRADCRSSASSSCSPISGSGSRAKERNSRAASSRCWRSRRILRTGAKLLLLDEPTEGLAPMIVQQIGRTVREIKALRLHRAAGRAEFPLRRDSRRPPLSDGAWARRRHDSERPARCQRGQAACLSRRLNAAKSSQGRKRS